MFYQSTSFEMGRLNKARGDLRMPEKDKKNYSNDSNILWKTLGTFSQQTSISGVSNAAIAKSYLRTAFWLLIFTVFGIFTLIGFQDVVNDYLDYTVTTSIRVQHQSQVSKILEKGKTNQSFLRINTQL